MILVWGPSGDPPLEHVLGTLRERNVAVVHLDDSHLADLRYDVAFGPDLSGWIELEGSKLAVEHLSGVYLRPGEQRHDPAATAAMVVLGVAARSAATVVNRPGAGRSNWSKPYQLGLIAAAGIAVPETLVTTDPEQAAVFLAKHQRLVYKSVSGVRSIVATLEPHESGRLTQVSTGPVQLQRWIDGLDVRVHVVGEQWFATAVDSEAPDYRYAARDGHEIAMAPIDIPDELAKRLVALTRQLGLLVSGVDLRLTHDGEWYGFEVNPSPGFTFYEEATGQPIGDAIVDLLLSRTPG